MHLSPDQIVFSIYLVIFLAIQTVILMGYIDLRRKHEKLRAEVEELKSK